MKNMKMTDKQRLDLSMLHHEEQSESWLRDNRGNLETAFVYGDADITTEALEHSVICTLAQVANFNKRVLHLDPEDLKEWVKTATWKDVAMFLYNTMYEDLTDAIDRDQEDEGLDDIDSGMLRSVILTALVENKEACATETGDNIGE